MAFANAFLGICHSIAHKLGAAFHIPHGLANAALITHVIAYNATDVPFKQVWLNSYRWSVSAATLLSKCLRIMPFFHDCRPSSRSTSTPRQSTAMLKSRRI